MWLIRDDQMTALGSGVLRGQRELMRRHVREQFPNEVRGVTDAALDRMLERVCAEALGYGIEELRDVLLWINLSLLLGEGFLARGDLAWMRGILGRPLTARQRMRTLYAEAVRRHG